MRLIEKISKRVAESTKLQQKRMFRQLSQEELMQVYTL